MLHSMKDSGRFREPSDDLGVFGWYRRAGGDQTRDWSVYADG